MNWFISPTDRLKVAALILIVLGVAETIVFVLAITREFNFAGGSLVYIYAGYRLLKRSTQTYKTVTRVLTAVVAFFMAGIWFSLLLTIYVLEVDGLTVKLTPPLIPILVSITYGAIIAALTSLLFHPDTRRELNLDPAGESAWMLFLSRKRMIGVVVSGCILAGLLLGPHLKSNPLQSIVSTIWQDPQVRTAVGSVDKISLLSIHAFNWTIHTAVEVVGSGNTGFYYAELPPNGTVRLDSYDFARMPELVPILSRSPEVEEFQALDYVSENEVLLLSTSFESQATNGTSEILPFVQDGKLAWERRVTAHSGQYAINAIPEGNPGLLSYFTESLSSVLLSSRLDSTYEPFDVESFDVVTLDFWRYSTSNPSETHNCLGSVRVDYRFDDRDWETKMVYCGRHKSKAMKWSHGLLTFDTEGKGKMEIKFEYEFPPSSRLDKTAMYLIDDLQIRGSR